MNKLKIYSFEEIDSTNSEAKRRIKSGLSENALFLAEKQTNGRGRLGRDFFSPGEGLYMSLALKKELPLDFALRITEKAAVSVFKALVSVRKDIVPKIKWVNDIYLNGKKICGILTESVLNEKMTATDFLIIGIGINLSNTAFPESLSSKAGSVTPGEKWSAEDIYSLIEKICANLFFEIENPENMSYIDICRKNSYVLGKRITFIKNEKEYAAFAKDIDSEGRLLTVLESGEEMLLDSGEISLKI